MRCRRPRKSINCGAVVVAFGAGLVVAFCCPKTVLVAILAILLIALGIAIAR